VIKHALAVANSKGGVGKSSIAANVAGLAARAGWRVLVVEMDTQGNVARDFGVVERSDRGAALQRAVRDGTPLTVMREVRPNLDYVAGGAETEQVYRELSGLRDGVPSHHLLDEALGTIADEYDLVVIDSPPGEQHAQIAIMMTAHFLLCPTSTDLGSIDGLSTSLTRAANVRRLYNPALEVLGAVLTMVGSSATALSGQARSEIERRSDGLLKVYEPPLRFSRGAADACRAHGLLVHELEAAAGGQAKKLQKQYGFAWWAQMTKEARRDLRRLPDARGLAEDYEALGNTVLSDLRERLG
jgi:chromosome partitioning protein